MKESKNNANNKKNNLFILGSHGLRIINKFIQMDRR